MSERIVTLRPAGIDDTEFLFQVYADTRAEELAPVPWNDEHKEAFLRQQFAAQDAAYRENYPDAEFSVIERDGAPIGRLYLATLDGHDRRIMDIALLAEFRNRGIGTGLIRDIMAAADHDGMLVSLHVEFWNPALQLYERLGFHEAARNDVYIRMEREPSGPSPLR